MLPIRASTLASPVSASKPRSLSLSTSDDCERSTLHALAPMSVRFCTAAASQSRDDPLLDSQNLRYQTAPVLVNDCPTTVALCCSVLPQSMPLTPLRHVRPSGMGRR